MSSLTCSAGASPARGVTVRQETRWPEGDTATFTLTCEQPQELELRLRHPHWARQGIVLTVNGQPTATREIAHRPGGILEILATA